MKHEMARRPSAGLAIPKRLRMTAVVFSVVALGSLLQHQAPFLTTSSASGRRRLQRSAPLVAAFDWKGADSWAQLGQQAVAAAQQGANAAAPIVQSGVEQAAPVVKSGVIGAAELAGRTAAKAAAGIEASLPALTDLSGKAAEGATQVLGKAAETSTQLIGNAVDPLRASLTPEQLQQLDKGLKVSGEVSQVVSGVAVSTAKTSAELAKAAAPVLQQGLKVGVEKGVPLAGEVARKTITAVDSGVKDVSPLVEELVRSGRLQPETVQRVEGGVLGALQGGVRNVASGMRSVADLVAPDAGSAGASAAAAGTSRGAVPLLPSTKEVTDSMASSLVQASAPYAFGALILSLSLSAIRELLEPLEQVVRRTLAAALLALIAKITYENVRQPVSTCVAALPIPAAVRVLTRTSPDSDAFVAWRQWDAIYGLYTTLTSL